MPRLSSPLDAKASVRSPYALDRSQQNSCVGTVCLPAVRKDRKNAHTCALFFDVFSSLPSKLQGKPGEPFNSQCHCPARSSTRPENLFAYDRLPLGQRACRAVARKAGEGWWSQTGSNRRPHACKARALPTELWPLPRSRARLGACPTCSPEGSMVGPGRLELPTSRLSGVCSNHLSYRPLKRHVQAIPEDPSPDTRSHHNLNRLRCLAERETKTATSCLPVYVYDEPVRP